MPCAQGTAAKWRIQGMQRQSVLIVERYQALDKDALVAHGGKLVWETLQLLEFDKGASKQVSGSE